MNMVLVSEMELMEVSGGRSQRDQYNDIARVLALAAAATMNPKLAIVAAGFALAAQWSQ